MLLDKSNKITPKPPGGERYTDFLNTRAHIDNAKSIQDVKIAAERFHYELGTVDDMLQIWHLDEQKHLDQWWEKQAPVCSQVACFFHDIMYGIATKCGLKTSKNLKKEFDVLENLAKTPIEAVTFRQAYLIFDNLMAALRDVPDDCEFWDLQYDWSEDHSDSVVAVCGKKRFICYIPNEYLI